MIECQICKRMLGRLTGKHLASHNITAAEYRERYPGHDTCIKKPVSEETRAKMRASRAGYKHSEETKAKIGSKHKGKTRTPEEIDKWRTSYAEYLKENGSPMLGKDRGEAFKRKMSEIARNRPPEMVQVKVEQMWAARRGSKATEEQRERYSQARLKFMQENPDKLVPKLFNTRPEREFSAELEKRGIAHERNVQVGGRVYDFRLDGMILIEIDGPYHWNYKMYGNKNMPDTERMALFEEAKKNDIYKNELAVKNNYKLYRIKVEGGLPSDWQAQLNNQGFQI
jgi:hypothetical protein